MRKPIPEIVLLLMTMAIAWADQNNYRHAIESSNPKLLIDAQKAASLAAKLNWTDDDGIPLTGAGTVEPGKMTYDAFNKLVFRIEKAERSLSRIRNAAKQQELQTKLLEVLK
jgi:hypothetical protein